MYLKKLDNYEIECVAAGIPKSAKYAALSITSLCLCSFAGWGAEELLDSRLIGLFVGALTGAIVPKLLGGGTIDLSKKAWEAFCKENPEAAEALIEIFTLPGLSDLEREERLSRFI